MPIVQQDFVNVSTGTIVAATSPPTATNAGTDTSYTFSTTVHHIIIQNNTTAIAYCDFDVAATVGSFAVYPNGQMIVFDIPCTILHLYTAAAQNVNGSTVGNIVIRGWV